ncbi:membrane progestin receptor gamma-B-like isoform X2 [Myripristis murdjan]|uniref:membrane progestin receptor gamma-B-like isoform X2 n=1 Tax=Myripristis murdjan TaxID=586833 RepID=UPI001175CEF0|nr:membrane progestin receptor gamma-B-like isoform X2 [Myripristis murdjan]
MLSLIKLPQVFTINQVPKVFHEDSIISGYRHPRSSATDCILSLFQLTNETLNIWTHFLPTWYFLWKLMTVVVIQTAWQDTFTWPLVVYLLSCCIYPLASSCAHTFSSMSARARHICFFFDYGALSYYSLGSAVTYSAYVFPDKWVGSVFHRCYLPVALVNSVICTSLACYSRFPEYQSPKFGKILRVFAFAHPFLFDNIPLFYRVFVCVGEGCTDNDTNILHYYHIGLAFLTGFLFATHLPERLAPGSFDYIGHSHQLFHVCGILGTHFQMQAIEQDMVTRRHWLQTQSLPVSFANSLGVAGLCVVLNLSIIILYSLPLLLPSAENQNMGKVQRRLPPTKACACD